MPSPDPEAMPMLRTGVFNGNPSMFPVPFLATSLQLSVQRSLILGGEIATLHYEQYDPVTFQEHQQESVGSGLVVSRRGGNRFHHEGVSDSCTNGQT